MDTGTLKQILIEEMQQYAGEGLNATSYFTENENENLRDLLDAAQKVPDRVLMAELIEVSLDPYTHKILVDTLSLMVLKEL